MSIQRDRMSRPFMPGMILIIVPRDVTTLVIPNYKGDGPHLEHPEA